MCSSDLVPEAAAGEDAAERHAVGALVRQALARLPRQQRAVLVLRYCQDLPEAEVASLLGCSAGAVKTHAQALLALLKTGAKVLAEGSVTGPGWTGTRYRFTVSHPAGTGGLGDSITCTVDVDSRGHIRSLAQATVFVANGKPGTAGKMIDTADFTFSDFGIRFSVAPPPASQIDHDLGAAVQF